VLCLLFYGPRVSSCTEIGDVSFQELRRCVMLPPTRAALLPDTVLPELGPNYVAMRDKSYSTTVCKSGCRGRCSCSNKNRLPCTPLCKYYAGDCVNQYRRSDVHDYKSLVRGFTCILFMTVNQNGTNYFMDIHSVLDAISIAINKKWFSIFVAKIQPKLLFS